MTDLHLNPQKQVLGTLYREDVNAIRPHLHHSRVAFDAEGPGRRFESLVWVGAANDIPRLSRRHIYTRFGSPWPTPSLSPLTSQFFYLPGHVIELRGWDKEVEKFQPHFFAQLATGARRFLADEDPEWTESVVKAERIETDDMTFVRTHHRTPKGLPFELEIVATPHVHEGTVAEWVITGQDEHGIDATVRAFSVTETSRASVAEYIGTRDYIGRQILRAAEALTDAQQDQH